MQVAHIGTIVSGLGLLAVSVVASIVDEAVIQVVARKEQMDPEDCHSYFVNTLCLYQQLLLKMDTDLVTPELLAIESAGYTTELSFAMARQWREAMSTHCGRSVEQLLVAWAQHLTEVIQNFRASNPQWNACFAGGSIDVKSVQAICVGKVAAVAESHNMIVTVLAKIKKSAERLQIRPPIKDHEITRHSIILAMNARDDASISYHTTLNQNSYGDGLMSDLIRFSIWKLGFCLCPRT